MVLTWNSSESPGMALADFAAPADLSQAGFFDPTPVANWYTADVSSGASFINLTGPTQFRIYFNLDDNDDLGADQVRFYSGNASVVANRPVLVVEYYIP